MLIRWAKKILQSLKNPSSLFRRKKETSFDIPKNFERGVFRVDEVTGKLTKVYDAPRDSIGKYPMMLAEYLQRKHHVSKGSWKRPIDKDHASKEALSGEDYGLLGCKSGVGLFHPLHDGVCKYCGLTPDQIKKKWEEIDREKQGKNDQV